MQQRNPLVPHAVDRDGARTAPRTSSSPQRAVPSSCLRCHCSMRFGLQAVDDRARSTSSARWEVFAESTVPVLLYTLW